MSRGPFRRPYYPPRYRPASPEQRVKNAEEWKKTNRHLLLGILIFMVVVLLFNLAH